jgi:hypothetical protein
MNKSIRHLLATTMTLGALCTAAYADNTLQPMQAYSLGPDEHPTVVYYTETGQGYEVVTTWLANEGRGPMMRHSAYLAPGEHYTLSLPGTGLPVEFTIHSDAVHVAMESETQDAAVAELNPATRCAAVAAFEPTPVQQMLLCPPGSGERLTSR